MIFLLSVHHVFLAGKIKFVKRVKFQRNSLRTVWCLHYLYLPLSYIIAVYYFMLGKAVHFYYWHRKFKAKWTLYFHLPILLLLWEVWHPCPWRKTSEGGQHRVVKSEKRGLWVWFWWDDWVYLTPRNRVPPFIPLQSPHLIPFLPSPKLFEPYTEILPLLSPSHSALLSTHNGCTVLGLLTLHSDCTLGSKLAKRTYWPTGGQ